MSNISVTNINDGDAITAASVNNQINTIVNDYNGNVDNTNIKTGANIATAKLAGDAGVIYTMVASGFAVQMVYNQTGAVATGTTTLPHDDTIPQNTEGTQFMTQAITPKSTTNILVIEVVAYFSQGTAASDMGGAIFQDSTANALASGMMRNVAADTQQPMVITHHMVAGTTSSTTFKFRMGSASSNTITFNGSSSSRLYGGVLASFMRITEYKA